MDEQELEKLAEKYKKQLEKLDTETLNVIANDFYKAAKYAKAGLAKIEPKNLDSKHVEFVANEMQTVARLLLKERLTN
ncbi:MAG TPA: hypothetical protein VMR41_05395 [Patescibacteria group bacterium]|nr:hypothetical protein [Patescibacteria group bacterium]